MNTITNSTKPHRGGARPLPDDVKVAKVNRVARILRAGYGMEVACKRAGTTSITVRTWAEELGLKLPQPR
jgi:hypothetical protein